MLLILKVLAKWFTLPPELLSYSLLLLWFVPSFMHSLLKKLKQNHYGIHKCLLKISPKCVLDIIGVVFENITITDACCHDLVQEAKMCHSTLIKYIAEKPHLVAHETKYLKKSDDLWTHCVSILQTA